MSTAVETHSADTRVSQRGLLVVAGSLLVGGYAVNVASTAVHPSGEENDHPAIFAEYADSGGWVAIHLGQFVGVSLALAGLLVLYRAMRATGSATLVATFAAGATVATGAVWAVLQGLDGVGLKEAVDAWAAASGAEKARRFADAETVRWLEWGFQSYFRLLLGLTFGLFGAAIVRTGVVAAWLGWVLIVAGVLSIVIGVDVGYSGLTSSLQDSLGVMFVVLVLAFAVGVLVAGVRGRGAPAPART